MAAQGSSIRTKTPARDSDLPCIHCLPGKDAHRSASQGSLFWFPSSQVLQTCHSSDSNWIHWCPIILVCQHGPGRYWQASLLWHTFLMLPLKPRPDCVEPLALDTYSTTADTAKPSLVPLPLTILRTWDSTCRLSVTTRVPLMKCTVAQRCWGVEASGRSGCNRWRWGYKCPSFLTSSIGQYATSQRSPGAPAVHSNNVLIIAYSILASFPSTSHFSSSYRN